MVGCNRAKRHCTETLRPPAPMRPSGQGSIGAIGLTPDCHPTAQAEHTDESGLHRAARRAGGAQVRRPARPCGRRRRGCRRHPCRERQRRRLEGAGRRLVSTGALPAHPGSRFLGRRQQCGSPASPNSASAIRSSASARRTARAATPRSSPSGPPSSRASRTACRTSRRPPWRSSASRPSSPSRSTLKLQAGETILIQGGAGGVAAFAIQLAKHIGARVITTTSAANLSYVRGLGADEVIDYTTQDFTTLISGCDAVFETVGGDVALRSFAVLKPGGRAAFIASGPQAPASPPGRAVAAAQRRPRPAPPGAHRGPGDAPGPSGSPRSPPSAGTGGRGD